MARTIVAGYDGSQAAEAAVERAVERAGSDGEVVLVTAYEPPSEWLGFPDYDRALEKGRAAAQALLDALVLERAELLTGVAFDTELIAAGAADAIVRVAEARAADEIVVGSRGAGRARALLGSVAHDVINRADRPVVVIPERAARAHPPGAEATARSA